MQLLTWLEAQRGRAKSLAAHLAVSSATISEWANKKKPVPVDRCTPVELFTHGEVTRPELRDDWRTHWPELAKDAPLPAQPMRRATDRPHPLRRSTDVQPGGSPTLAGEG